MSPEQCALDDKTLLPEEVMKLQLTGQESQVPLLGTEFRLTGGRFTNQDCKRQLFLVPQSKTWTIGPIGMKAALLG